MLKQFFLCLNILCTTSLSFTGIDWASHVGTLVWQSCLVFAPPSSSLSDVCNFVFDVCNDWACSEWLKGSDSVVMLDFFSAASAFAIDVADGDSVGVLLNVSTLKLSEERDVDVLSFPAFAACGSTPFSPGENSSHAVKITDFMKQEYDKESRWEEDKMITGKRQKW